MDYYTLKTIHILSATLMIGTGLGSAFYLFVSYKTKQFSTVKDILNIVIIADLFFTTPSVITQLVTGLLLVDYLHINNTLWYVVVLSMSFGVLVLWLFAVRIQYQLQKIGKIHTKIPAIFHRKIKIWVYLGIPSFVLSIYLYYLMIFKPFI